MAAQLVPHIPFLESSRVETIKRKSLDSLINFRCLGKQVISIHKFAKHISLSLLHLHKDISKSIRNLLLLHC
jgi:hypothetical protein